MLRKKLVGKVLLKLWGKAKVRAQMSEQVGLVFSSFVKVPDHK
jgi:hypothetical protein